MILVTGASGSSGGEIVKRLSGIGIAIRAMVRTPRGQSKGELPGVEFVTADFNQPETIRRALESVDRAYLVTNSTERVGNQQLRFVQLAVKPESDTWCTSPNSTRLAYQPRFNRSLVRLPVHS